jgi:competence protein ComEA
LKKFLREYFTFSRFERNAIVVIAMLVLAFLIYALVVPQIYFGNEEMDLSTVKSFISDYESEENLDTIEGENVTDPLYDYSLNEYELFYFDPNTASAEEWKQLGVKDYTIKTIQKYLSKGGYFYKPEDLGKIYNLDDDTYNRLKPFVRIKEKNEKSESLDFKKMHEDKEVDKVFLIVEINSCTKSDLMQISGIGKTYAGNILKYRELLGGYFSKSQLLEVYGIDSLVYKKIEKHLEVDSSLISQISINLAEKMILLHTYILTTNWQKKL